MRTVVLIALNKRVNENNIPLVDSTYANSKEALQRVKELQRKGFHAHAVPAMDNGFDDEWLNAHALKRG